ncbi:MAG: GNAT family N-acetyltransferase [Bdellovibrionales bacterium]|nr:GNAT family N-acetyltransferase [Bdellovibrionales bacterium]
MSKIKIIESLGAKELSCMKGRALFQSLEYYDALIRSRSMSLRSGWKPYFFCVEDGGKTTAVLPVFERTQSSDEFIYDQCFVENFERRTKQKYYPKASLCMPFVPIEGSKIITDQDAYLNKEHIQIMEEWSKAQGHSSFHIALPSHTEYDLLDFMGYISSDQSLGYWHNRNYVDFESFLLSLRSKYRAQIKKERLHIRFKGYQHFFLRGGEIQGRHIDMFFDLFEATHHRKGWKMSQLQREFFHLLAQSRAKDMLLIFLTQKNQTVAASCCFFHDDLLCGRFWGSTHDLDYVHFEVMYYLPIAYAIEHRVSKMEIGFMKVHKLIRGFESKSVRSYHRSLIPEVPLHYPEALSESFGDKQIFLSI